MKGVKDHMGTNEGDRVGKQTALKPPQYTGKTQELSDNHGVRNCIIGKASDPGWLDET